MADPLVTELRDVAREAARLSWFAGGLDVLHEALPSAHHPDAGEIERRAADALAETIRVVIERTEALADRLEGLAAAAGKAGA